MLPKGFDRGNRGKWLGSKMTMLSIIYLAIVRDTVVGSYSLIDSRWLCKKQFENCLSDPDENFA